MQSGGQRELRRPRIAHALGGEGDEHDPTKLMTKPTRPPPTPPCPEGSGPGTSPPDVEQVCAASPVLTHDVGVVGASMDATDTPRRAVVLAGCPVPPRLPVEEVPETCPALLR